MLSKFVQKIFEIARNFDLRSTLKNRQRPVPFPNPPASNATAKSNCNVLQMFQRRLQRLIFGLSQLILTM